LIGAVCLVPVARSVVAGWLTCPVPDHSLFAAFTTAQYAVASVSLTCCSVTSSVTEPVSDINPVTAFSAGLSRAYAELGVEVAGLDVAGRVALVIGEESLSAARSTELSSPYTVVVVVNTGLIVACCVTAPVTPLRIRTAYRTRSAEPLVKSTSCGVAGVVTRAIVK
jgi:hypothetical protein